MQTNRDTIRGELKELARSYIAASDSHPTKIDEPGRRVSLEWVDGNPILTHTLEVDGINKERFDELCRNYYDNVRAIAPENIQYFERGEDGGCKVIHQRITTGVPMVSNRSVITAAYHDKEEDENGDEALIFILSSRGNDHLSE